MLINANFKRPVNQRGYTTYTHTSGVGIFTIDRWVMGHGSLTIDYRSVILKPQASGTMMYFGQRIDLYDFNIAVNTSAQMAITLVTSDNTYTHVFTIPKELPYNEAFTSSDDFKISDTWSIGFIKAANNAYVSLRIYQTQTSAEYLTLRSVKLEIGEHITPIPFFDYDSEYRKCLRYFTKISANLIGVGSTGTNNNIYIPVCIPEPMRERPLYITGTDTEYGVKISSVGFFGGTDVTFVDVFNSQNNMVVLRFLINTNIPSDELVSVYSINFGAYVALDAEFK